MEDDSRKWALYFFFLGVESGFGIVIQVSNYTKIIEFDCHKEK